MKRTRFLGLIWISVFGSLLLHGCEAPEIRAPRMAEGRPYGITRGPFKGQWYHYYERGLSFADGGFWKDAELDLKAALRQKDSESRMTETYGLRYIEYFPHGELGVVLYHQALATNSPVLLKDAVHELRLSVAATKYAKAEYYLDLARKALLNIENRPLIPPKIIIESPRPNFITNDLSVTIQGVARDEFHFVRKIEIGGRKYRIDVSAEEIPFRMRVPIRSNTKEIIIRATNLSDITTEVKVPITVDRIGPVIAADGIISDNVGLSAISINGRSHPANGRLLNIRKMIQSSVGDGTRLKVSARDVAGNETIAVLSSAALTKAAGSRLLAMNGSESDANLSDQPRSLWYAASRQTRQPVEVRLTDDALERATYLPEAVVQIEVICGENTALDIRNRDTKEQIYNDIIEGEAPFNFSFPVALQQGVNWVRIVARGKRSGKSASLTLRITRNTPTYLHPDERLKIGMAHKFVVFIPKDGGERQSVGFEDYFLTNLINHEPKRFSKVAELVLEDSPSESSGDYIDRKKIIQTAVQDGLHCVLLGYVTERPKPGEKREIRVRAALLDAEDHRIVKKEDTEVFFDDVDDRNIENKLKTLAKLMQIKLMDELPLVQGNVTDAGDRRIGLDIGGDEKLKPHMDLLVYKPGSPSEDPPIIGSAKVERVVSGNKSTAELYQKTEAVHPDYQVITR